jgi:hypothetical protein
MKSCLQDTKSHKAGKRCRKVTIDLSKNTSQEIIHRAEMTDDYMKAVWLTAQDFKEIKKDFTATIRSMMKVNSEQLEETNECSCRGLGKYWFSQHAERRQN